MTPPDNELDELRHLKTMAGAELAHLRPLALRETIRQAGFDPDSSAGKTLAELAKTNESLRTSVSMMRTKAVELGLSTKTVEEPVSPVPAPSELTDPSLPATHSVNTPGTPAHDQALAKTALREPFREAAERMLSNTTDANGYHPGESSPLQAAAERLAEKWRPPPGPNPRSAKTVDVPPPTDAERQASKAEFLAHRKAADKDFHSTIREAAAKMLS